MDLKTTKTKFHVSKEFGVSTYELPKQRIPYQTLANRYINRGNYYQNH